MQIHVARPPNQLGVFSQEEVAAGLQSGRFLPTDQGWREGMSAWTPLSQWSEFAGLSVPAAPASSVAQGSPAAALAPVGPSQLPWEQGRSLASAWQSVVAMVTRPAEVLGNARLDIGPTLTLGWFILGVSSVTAVIGGVVYADQLAAVMVEAGSVILQSANQLPGPAGELMGKFGDYYAKTEPKNFGAVLLQAWMMVLFAPFIHFFLGLLQWFALRLLGLFGVKACQGLPLGRTVIATMLGACLGSLVFMLTPLLPPGLLQNAVIYSCFIPFMIVYARVVGAALKVNPWVVFGSAALCYLLFVCCCGCGMAVMVGALMTG
ncbi:MAG: hypothetical protein RJA48_999 [Verrucomicrobiota bacterium]|jgi:hypothetical protein